jgi:hypothetical protein
MRAVRRSSCLSPGPRVLWVAGPRPRSGCLCGRGACPAPIALCRLRLFVFVAGAPAPATTLCAGFAGSGCSLGSGGSLLVRIRDEWVRGGAVMLVAGARGMLRRLLARRWAFGISARVMGTSATLWDAAVAGLHLPSCPLFRLVCTACTCCANALHNSCSHQTPTSFPRVRRRTTSLTDVVPGVFSMNSRSMSRTYASSLHRR